MLITNSIRLLVGLLLCLTLQLAAALPAAAHADIHERIVALTGRIVEQPDNPVLYLKRGELYRLHHDWAAAEADYLHGARLDPQLKLVDFYRGRMWLEAGQPAFALQALDHYLEYRTDHGEAYLARARTLAQLERPLAAARDYDAVLTLLKSPAPEYYIERARLLATAGEGQFEEALRGLAEGLARLGPLVSLEQVALRLEIEAGRYTAALNRLDKLITRPGRPERWLEQRGEVLLLAKQPEQAEAEFRKALAAIEKLPDHRRRVRGMVAFETRLRTRLETVEAASTI